MCSCNKVTQISCCLSKQVSRQLELISFFLSKSHLIINNSLTWGESERLIDLAEQDLIVLTFLLHNYCIPTVIEKTDPTSYRRPSGFSILVHQSLSLDVRGYKLIGLITFLLDTKSFFHSCYPTWAARCSVGWGSRQCSCPQCNTAKTRCVGPCAHSDPSQSSRDSIYRAG